MKTSFARTLVLTLTQALLSASVALAADQPLGKLPYHPGLDPASMDRSANACTDFYQFACGGWMAQNPIPSDEASWSVYGKLYQDNQQFLWGILDDLAGRSADRSAAQEKMGDYFASCMNESLIESRGATPLAPSLARIEALQEMRELPALIAALQIGAHTSLLFEFGSNQDFADATQVIAFAAAGGLGMPDRDYYTDADEAAGRIRAQYLAHVKRMFVLLGEDPAAAGADAATVLKFETQLARASFTRVELRDPYKSFHRVERRDLARMTPHFDWSAYLHGLGLDHIERVNVTEPRFFAAMDRLLASSRLEDLKTYLRWHVAEGGARYLSTAFADEYFEFNSHVLQGIPTQRPRWKRCVGLVDQQLGEALGQEFVARAFGPELKAATIRMSEQIEQAMREDIRNLSWMSEATKRQALAKLDSIVNKIGYPEHWRDYGAVIVRRNDFFGNVERATVFESQRQLAKIGKPLDRSEWGMTPQTVNAYYNAQMNDINFPAGVLQPPLYDPSLDDAPNYGNTGGTIGHELTHGFDDEGRQFDAAGNLKNWWTQGDAKEFNRRTQCIVDQYAKYVVVDDIHLNSRLTLGEDVADLGGLILAHMAWRVQSAAQMLVDRDGLTPEQRFFVGYAQWACENQRPENQRLEAKTDPHSPGRYRVNGVLVNMPEFRRAFACPVNQPMVKATPCRVW